MRVGIRQAHASEQDLEKEQHLPSVPTQIRVKATSAGIEDVEPVVRVSKVRQESRIGGHHHFIQQAECPVEAISMKERKDKGGPPRR